MPSIQATKILFKPEHAFRKFRNLELPLAPRITLIAGHNGVGKSTILGMLSSLSGIRTVERSYFGKAFDANIGEIVYIDYATEVHAPKVAGKLAEPTVLYNVDGVELVKECSLTKRGTAARARVVSRSVPHKKFVNGEISIGPDAKVPLPTIFLGVVRMLPVGESPDSRVQNVVAEKWHRDDQDFMLRMVQRIIPGAGAEKGAISINRIKQTSKLATHPKYPYGPRSVSLGQDSLGAIVTALASFHRIKRKLGDQYPGGLLIIDELDASFHPHAIGVLVTELRRAADELSLQIVATTHSTKLIEAVHPQGPNRKVAHNDRVLYLRNTKAPKFDEDFGLADILRDMDLVPPTAKPKPPEIKVYFEDDEAHEVFKLVTPAAVLRQIGADNNVVIKSMPLGIGCSSLTMLPAKDPYFETVVLAVDADSSMPRTVPKNLVRLPGDKDANGNGLSPERTIIKYIRALVADHPDQHPIAWSDPRLKPYSQENLEENLLQGFDDPLSRTAAKAWWREKKEYLSQWGLYKIWAKVNADAITEYHENLAAAVKAAAKAHRTREELAKRGGVL